MADHRHKRCVIAEELLSITDDFREAAVLRQMLFWLPRRRDVDQFIIEERERRKEDLDVTPTQGWIYKSGEELADEVMIMAGSTARRKLQSLVEKGFLDERSNPNMAWDQTMQYRPNPTAIQDALEENGYTIATVMGEDYPSVKSLFKANEPNPHSEDSITHSSESNVQRADSNTHSSYAIPETTTKTTTEREAAPAREDDLSDSRGGEKPKAEDRRPDFAPTLEQVKTAAPSIGATKELAEKFYWHYESRNWQSNGNKIKRWKAELKKWQLNEHRFTNNGTGSSGMSLKEKEAIREKRMRVG